MKNDIIDLGAYNSFYRVLFKILYLKNRYEKMKKKKNTIANLYNINPETSAFLIEISLDNYQELFNGWDASPLKRRDLEPELLDYIEQCGEEIPLEEDLELHLYLPEALREEEKELRCKTVIFNNFKTVLFFIKKSLKKIYRKMFTDIILSILFLTAAYLLRHIINREGIFTTIFVEGIYIGGWVLLWEAFSLFFFNSYEIRQRKKIYERFLKMDIYFKYHNRP